MLTGSASKGRSRYYYYYHCSSECGVRFKAEYVNIEFKKELRKYTTTLPNLTLYREAIKISYKSQTAATRQISDLLKKQLADVNSKLTKARDLLLSDAIGADDFKVIKTDCESKIALFEEQLFLKPKNTPDLAPLWEMAISSLSNIEKVYEEGTIEEQRLIIGSMFPEKLTFDGTQHRTARVNEIAKIISLIDSSFCGKKNGTSRGFFDLSQEVIPLGLEPCEIKLLLSVYYVIKFKTYTAKYTEFFMSI